MTDGKLSGGLTVPVGTECAVAERRGANDFYSNGRATLAVVLNNVIEFTVFESEVEFLPAQ
jgi:hypothetical protein